MAFKADLLKRLREAKSLSQEDVAGLAGVSQSVIAKAERGKSVPGGDVLYKLACALDCTMDYLYGRGVEYEDASTAAAHMAFDVFARNESVSETQRERCRRALKHPDAPKTVKAWRAFSEMMELSMATMGSSSAKLTVIKHRPGKSKPATILRRDSRTTR